MPWSVFYSSYPFCSSDKRVAKGTFLPSRAKWKSSFPYLQSTSFLLPQSFYPFPLIVLVWGLGLLCSRAAFLFIVEVCPCILRKHILSALGHPGLLIWLYLKGLRREGEWENPGYRVCLQVANVEGSKGQRSGTGSDEKQDLLFLALFPNLTFQGARLVGLFLPVSLIRPKPLKIYLMTLWSRSYQQKSWSSSCWDWMFVGKAVNTRSFGDVKCMEVDTMVHEQASPSNSLHLCFLSQPHTNRKAELCLCLLGMTFSEHSP